MRVLSTGMTSPIGFSSEACCAAMRCGLSNFQELPFVHSSGEKVIGSAVPNLGCDFEDDLRIQKLLLSAIRDCLSDAQPNLGLIPVILSLSEAGRPGGSDKRAGELLGEVLNSDVANWDRNRSQALTTGHTACFESLALARDLLRRSDISACLLCGVDSYLNTETLRWLEEDHRLKMADNSDGLIPGECAAAVLIGSADRGDHENHPLVIGLGSCFESTGVLSDEPVRGEGLSEATRIAISEAKLKLHEIGFRISDVTGESYGFKEQALVVSRLMRGRPEEFPLWHPAQSIGDVGAATGAVQLVVLQKAFMKGYSVGTSAACFTSAVPGNRAVAIIEWS